MDFNDPLRMNKRLMTVWKQAQMAGFDGQYLTWTYVVKFWPTFLMIPFFIAESEMNALRTEFMHHQEKINEMEALKKELIDMKGGIK